MLQFFNICIYFQEVIHPGMSLLFFIFWHKAHLDVVFFAYISLHYTLPLFALSAGLIDTKRPSSSAKFAALEATSGLGLLASA